MPNAYEPLSKPNCMPITHINPHNAPPYALIMLICEINPPNMHKIKQKTHQIRRLVLKTIEIQLKYQQNRKIQIQWFRR